MTAAEELRTAAATLRAAVAAVASKDWPDQTWHIEKCVERDCLCIVCQGECGRWDEAQDPPVFYVADGETPEAARWIALMDPTVGLALAVWLEQEAAIWAGIAATEGVVKAEGWQLTVTVSTHSEALALARRINTKEQP